MKKTTSIPVLCASIMLLASGCEEWTTAEALQIDTPATEVSKSEEYYEALRAYKESEHSVAFGWFNNWGEPGLTTTSMLSGIPDSMDIVSLWSNYEGISEGKREDLKFVTQTKGTKVVICSFIAEIGAIFTPEEYDSSSEDRESYWGWEDGNDDAIKSSIERFAKAIADSISFYGYSGLDIDYESEYGGKLLNNDTYFTWFVEEMGKYIGPQSGTDRLFIIDGYYWQIPSPGELGRYFSYFVEQAYASGFSNPTENTSNSASNLESRLTSHYQTFSGLFTEEEFTNRFIATECLESVSDCLAGGFWWTDANGHRWSKSVMPDLVGFADWKPANGYRKGGFGSYQFGYEATNTPSYKWMRKAIQQQNPAPGYEIITLEDDITE